MDSLRCALFSVLTILTVVYSIPHPAFFQAERVPSDLKANSALAWAGPIANQKLALFRLLHLAADPETV